MQAHSTRTAIVAWTVIVVAVGILIALFLSKQINRTDSIMWVALLSLLLAPNFIFKTSLLAIPVKTTIPVLLAIYVLAVSARLEGSFGFSIAVSAIMHGIVPILLLNAVVVIGFTTFFRDRSNRSLSIGSEPQASALSGVQSRVTKIIRSIRSVFQNTDSVTFSRSRLRRLLLLTSVIEYSAAILGFLLITIYDLATCYSSAFAALSTSSCELLGYAGAYMLMLTPLFIAISLITTTAIIFSSPVTFLRKVAWLSLGCLVHTIPLLPVIIFILMGIAAGTA